jgi:non-ribosomal peptide synthetase component F
VIPDDVVIDPKRLVSFFSHHKVTRVMFTPSQLRNILDYPNLNLKRSFASLRHLYLCGEVVPSSLSKRFETRVPFATLWNNYSTWESLDVSYAKLPYKRSLTISRFAPAGKLAPGVTCRVVDPKTLKSVPFGVPGDLHVSAAHMSLGYITDPVKTKSKFYKHIDNQTYYNTGDRARILDDGSLELMGRKDDTIKIRGFKVPLPLVEAGVRASVSNVSSVVIHYLLNPETRQPRCLVAYIVCDDVLDRQNLYVVESLI